MIWLWSSLSTLILITPAAGSGILHCIQGLKCTGSQRVEDPALSNVPGIFVYSFTVSPVAVIEPDIEICGLNNETTEWRRTAGSFGLCHSK